jgi:hypothetical protein
MVTSDDLFPSSFIKFTFTPLCTINMYEVSLLFALCSLHPPTPSPLQISHNTPLYTVSVTLTYLYMHIALIPLCTVHKIRLLYMVHMNIFPHTVHMIVSHTVHMNILPHTVHLNIPHTVHMNILPHIVHVNIPHTVNMNILPHTVHVNIPHTVHMNILPHTVHVNILPTQRT